MDSTPAATPRYDERPVLLGLAVVRREPGGEGQLRVRWWYLAGVIVGTLALGWLLVATVLYFYFKIYRDFEDETFGDAFFILFHLKEHQRQIGEYYLRTADTDLQNQHLLEALADYRSGLIKVPDDLHGRTQLAQLTLYAYRNQEVDRAISILRDGLPYALNDPDYINGYLQILQHYNRDQQAITDCQTLLAKKPTNDKTTRILALNLVSFYVQDGNFDPADEILERYHLADHIEGVLLQGQSYWERGRRKAAVDYLENALPKFQGGDADALYALLSRYYRDLGDLDKSRQFTVLRIANNPMSVMPRIELLYIEAKSGESDAVESDSQNLIEEFSKDQNAMLTLANFATDQGNVPLARRIYERAIENQFDLTAFSLLLIEAHISAGDYDGALNFIDQIDQERPAWLAASQAIFDSLRAVAEYGKGRSDLADIFLTNILKQYAPRPETLVAIATRFQSLGGLPQAQRLLQFAVKKDPNNQMALVQLITVDLQMGDSSEIEANLNRLLAMRRPPLELILDAYRKLGSDHFIFVTHRESLLNKLNEQIQEATARQSAES
jgi:tetratricopeptide (TPR) repeat protein